MGLLEDIRSLLIDEGIGEDDAAAEWPIAIHSTPAGGRNESRAIVLIGYGGGVPQARATLDFPGLQVSVRGKPEQPEEAEAKAAEIYALLHERVNFELNGTTYAGCLAQHSRPHGPFYDGNRRPVFKQSFLFTVSRNQ